MHVDMEGGRKEEKKKKGKKGGKERRKMEFQQWKKVLTKTSFVPIGRYLLKTPRKLSQANSLRNKSLVYKKCVFYYSKFFYTKTS